MIEHINKVLHYYFNEASQKYFFDWSMFIEFLRKHKGSPLLKPFVRTKYHLLEKTFYLLYLLCPSIYSSKTLARHVNGTQAQIEHWTKSITENNDFELKQDFCWGQGELNQYCDHDAIKSMVTDLIEEDSVVLELGAYDGVWTQYFLKAKKIICVDVMAEAFDLIKKRCGTEKITFYKTRGNELAGIEGASVDLVFSIDSLMRTDLDDIERYFSEIKRVLKQGGKAIIHLPSISKRGCQLLFTYLTPGQIKDMANKNFKEFRLHHDLLPTGIILEGAK